VATSQPAIGKKKLAGDVLTTKPSHVHHGRTMVGRQATSHTAIGEKELATKGKAKPPEDERRLMTRGDCRRH